MPESKKAKSTVKRTLHYYWQEARKYKIYVFGVLLTAIIRVFINSILGPLIISDIIEKVSTDFVVGSEIIGEAVFYLILFAVSNFIFDQLEVFLGWRMELKVAYGLATQCFGVVNAQSMQFHSDRFSGSLVSQTNKFIGSFERLADTIIWDIVPLVTRVVLIVVVMWPLVPWYAGGILILVGVYTAIASVAYRRLGPLNEAEADTANRQTGQLADSITNIISIKSYAQERREQQRYANFAKKSYDASNKLMSATLIRNTIFSIVEVALMALVLALLLYGREWLGISIATLILIVNYSSTILNNLWGINGIFKNMNRVFGDSHDMTLILDMVDDVVDMPGAVPLVLNSADINFSNIKFQHADAKAPIFENFSLKIQPGERVGLVGVSGSGKTTLTKLLLRFADVEDGAVLVSDQNIKNVTQQSLRENVAYVPQETSLFHRSIAENIAYGKPDATPEEIQRAAKLANAHDFIMDLPDGYDTLVGERGIKLSGGQRQRIAIARAILKNAPVLVLDEATSALDSESEALIQEALNTLMRGRTSLVIAHRLSTVANLDRIVVLQNGKIVEQGSHTELLANPTGVYRGLWDRQSGAFLDEK